MSGVTYEDVMTWDPLRVQRWAQEVAGVAQSRRAHNSTALVDCTTCGCLHQVSHPTTLAR